MFGRFCHPTYVHFNRIQGTRAKLHFRFIAQRHTLLMRLVNSLPSFINTIRFEWWAPKELTNTEFPHFPQWKENIRRSVYESKKYCAYFHLKIVSVWHENRYALCQVQILAKEAAQARPAQKKQKCGLEADDEERHAEKYKFIFISMFWEHDEWQNDMFIHFFSLLFLSIVLWILPFAIRSLFFFSQHWRFPVTLILSKSHVTKARMSEWMHRFFFSTLNGFFSLKKLMKVSESKMKALCATFNRREQLWKRKCLCIVWSEGSRYLDSMAHFVVVAADVFFLFTRRPLHYAFLCFLFFLSYNQHSNDFCEQQGKLGIRIGGYNRVSTTAHFEKKKRKTDITIEKKQPRTKIYEVKNQKKESKKKPNLQRKSWIFPFACQFIKFADLFCLPCHYPGRCHWLLLSLLLMLC